MYSKDFHPGWKKYFDRLDNSVKVRIVNKMKKILEGLPGRHLERGLPYFVEEVDQHRICYKSDDVAMTRRFYFVGDHKEYLKWIGKEEARQSE
ncbi:MAG: hypothetical protein WCT52_02805 [Candidatus Micrarchaeia archaeon]